MGAHSLLLPAARNDYDERAFYVTLGTICANLCVLFPEESWLLVRSKYRGGIIKLPHPRPHRLVGVEAAG